MRPPLLVTTSSTVTGSPWLARATLNDALNGQVQWFRPRDQTDAQVEHQRQCEQEQFPLYRHDGCEDEQIDQPAQQQGAAHKIDSGFLS